MWFTAYMKEGRWFYPLCTILFIIYTLLSHDQHVAQLSGTGVTLQAPPSIGQLPNMSHRNAINKGASYDLSSNIHIPHFGGASRSSLNGADTNVSDGSRDHAKYKVVKRTHASLQTGVRFIFIAGVEGAGHHIFGSLFKACRESGVCEKADRLTRMMWNKDGPDQTPTNIIFPHGDDKSGSADMHKQFMNAMNDFTVSTGSGKVFFLNAFAPATKYTSRLSYPTGNGNPPSDHLFPDLTLVLDLCERAGHDCRVLAVHRPAHVLFKYNHRKNKATRRSDQEQERLLSMGASLLYTQLSVVDPAFYRVFRHYELVDNAYWAKNGDAQTWLFGPKDDRLPGI